MRRFVFVLGLATCVYGSDIEKSVVGEPSHEFTIIDYDGQRIPDALDAQMRYNTVIRLPRGELCREASSGSGADLSKPGSGDWIIVASTDADAVYVKPTRAGASTNLEIRTDKGNRYSFLLRDRSGEKGYHCKLEYIINPTGQGFLENIKQPPKFVLTEKWEEAKADAARYREQRDALDTKWQERFRSAAATATKDVLSGLACDYDLTHSEVVKQPFNVSQICHDSSFTYIWAKGAEHFSIQDSRQGAPVMIIPDYDPASGMYTIHQIIEHGRLQVGSGKKTKAAEFRRVGANAG